MKKIILLILAVMLLTGCSIQEIGKMSMDEIIDSVTVSNKNIYNRVGVGYKYYLPVGLLVESTDDYNEILYTNSHMYYLFVDIVSHYNKEDLQIEKVEDAYYYREFTYNDKKGYVQILKDNNEYYIKAVYNYAKMETYVEESYLKEALYHAVSILSSINYNESIVNDIIAKQQEIDGKEITIEDFTPKKSATTFLEYIEQYDDYDKTDDVDNLDIDTIIPNIID